MKFTEKEISFLIKNYPEKGKLWCAKKLKRTEGSIRSCASKLKLRINKKSSFFKEFQKRAAESKIGKKRPVHSKIMKEKADKGELWFQKNPKIKHGLSYTKAYVIWNSMMARCYKKNNDSFQYYGYRGIKVFKKWHDVSVFKKWFDENYSCDLTLDRINVNGDYEPKNCRFITMKEQARNRRNNVVNTKTVVLIKKMYKERVSQRQIAKVFSLNYKTVNNIVLNKNWN